MLWANVIMTPSSSMYAYKWEKVAFRAAWVSVTQLPLLYCLSGKFNIVSLLTGVSYERINWLHRWVARTMFLTVIVHWSFFFTEWSIANFVKFEIQMMPMVKYGFGAWGVLGWSVLTGFGFFRNLSYEIWLLQHLASAGVLLWLLYVHVPSYARYNIWLSIAFLAFDRIVRLLWSVAINVRLNRLWAKKSDSGPLAGFNATATALPNGYVHLTIKDIDFSWRPGQHMFISIPTCGVIESHPFTIAAPKPQEDNPAPSSINFYFKSHSGFTKRVWRKAESQPTKVFETRAFISRPLGTPPITSIERCNSLILVASSTGASFTVPIVEHAIKNAPFVRRIRFIWIIRHRRQLDWFHDRLVATGNVAERANIDFSIQYFVTGSKQEEHGISSHITSGQGGSNSLSKEFAEVQYLEKESSVDSSSSSQDGKPKTVEVINAQKEKGSGTEEISFATSSSNTTTSLNESASSSSSSFDSSTSAHQNSTSRIATYSGRPTSWDNLIHPTVAQAEGETVIVACGGSSLMSDVRNYTARLSDERAVHKGTGAQGIYLFTETYGWSV